MAPKILVRLVGALTCMAAVVTGFDAEAGWRHRRCCASSCCYTPCYSSCYTPCSTSCYDTCSSCSTCYTWRDSCGYCRTSCGYTTVVSAPVIVSDCCVATTTPAAVTQVATRAEAPAETPAGSEATSLAAATAR